jgi:ribose/xylose/arabinose/galactoside ABC-type transport system permease subunit
MYLLTKKRIDIKSMIARSGVYIVFFTIVVFFAFSNPRFLTINNLRLIIQQASPLGIAVVGMTFVMTVAGIDISIGSIMYFSALVASMLIRYGIISGALMTSGTGYLIVYALAVLIGAIFGFSNGFLISKFHIQPFIVTLSAGSIIRGLGYILCNSQNQDAATLSAFSNSRIMGHIPTIFILFLIVVTVFDFLLRRHSFGRYILAIGNSTKTAHVAGIYIERHVIVCYMICGVLSAFAGMLQAGQIGSVSIAFGDGNEFVVISAAVLGGTSLFGGKGTIIPGAVIGIFLITIILNGLAMVNASPYIYTIVRAVIIFLAVMLDSINFKGEVR